MTFKSSRKGRVRGTRKTVVDGITFDSLREANMYLIHLGWPSPKLNPNAAKGRNWRWSYKERKAAKLEGFYAAKEAGVHNLSGEHFNLKVTAYRKVDRGNDEDNFMASLKHHFDGIAKAMKTDDKHFHPEFDKFVPSEKSGVLVEVRARK